MLEGLIKSWKWVKVDESFNDSKNPRYIVSCPRAVSEVLSLSDETYGKESHLYFRWKTPEAADKALVALGREGLTKYVDLSWNGNTQLNFSMRVTYFKGHHYYE